MPPNYLYGTLLTKIVFTKQKLRPPRGAQTGAAASILKGVWGQFAPIITSNDFYRALFFNLVLHLHGPFSFVKQRE